MPQPSYGQLLSESFARIGAVLFSPFSWTKWMKLALVALVAGSLSTGGCGLNSLQQPSRDRSRALDSQKAEDAAERQAPKDETASKTEQAVKNRYQFVDSIFRPDPSQYPKISKAWLAAVLIPFLILLVLLLIAGWLLTLWLSVRLKFVWLRAVVENRADIRTLFNQCRKEADDLFDFWLGFSLLEIFSYVTVVAWMVIAVLSMGGGWGKRMDWAPDTALAVVGPPLACLLVLWLVFSAVRVIGDDFLVPLTVRFPGGARRVWSQWVEIYRRSRLATWAYLIMRLALSLFWTVVQVLGLVLFVALWALVFFLCWAPVAWMQKKWAVAGAYSWIAGLGIGVPLVGALILGCLMILLPGAVFIRHFSWRALERFLPGETPV